MAYQFVWLNSRIKNILQMHIHSSSLILCYSVAAVYSPIYYSKVGPTEIKVIDLIGQVAQRHNGECREWISHKVSFLFHFAQPCVVVWQYFTLAKLVFYDMAYNNIHIKMLMGHNQQLINGMDDQSHSQTMGCNYSRRWSLGIAEWLYPAWIMNIITATS